MNLTRVLNVALPEMPARSLADRPPRMPPDLVFKEHIEDGERIVRVVVANVDNMYRFPKANWELIQLFDGQRSYPEIAEIYSGQTGREYGTEQIREFADALEGMSFWYKTPQEKNVQLMQKTAEERRKLLKSRKSKFGDLSEIAFPAINPDKFVTWLYNRTRFIYTWWFTALTVVALGIAAAISIVHWNEIGQDTVEFFAFTNMSWKDLVIFYILAVLTMCWHELAHAHACKHYGGRVPAMGFALIYLTPAFYTDTSEGYVKGSRYQRFIIAMAGAFSELYICAVATVIWWGTATNSGVHQAAYLLMLMSGIAGLLINWNPLMKLDGYYMLMEALGIPDLKENSTAYVSAWVKRNIWRLPVDVPYVPRSRRFGFAVYGLLSGAYSYTVLYILARFVGNVFRSFNPEWSFIPELATAGIIFRSRIRTLVNFMKFVYLDKEQRIRSWLVSPKGVLCCAAVAAFLLIPIWRESADGRFVLEPLKTSIVHNVVAGTISDVYVREGMQVLQGAPLFRIRNLPLESLVSESEAKLAEASVRANDAGLRYANLGPALTEKDQFARQTRELRVQTTFLELESPMSGTVLSPRVEDLLGTYARPGTELVEIADLQEMRARVYIADLDLYKLRVGADARLGVVGFAELWRAKTVSISPVSTEIDPRIAEHIKYKGLNPQNFYVLDLRIANPEQVLKPGMTGVARVYGPRRSLVSHTVSEIVRFFGRKAW
jgi:putative peptide zinc metalloprotease protein